MRTQLRLKRLSGHRSCEVIRADSRLFEDAGAIGRQESNEARMKLERLRRGAARPANARFGRRDIASLLIMIGIFVMFSE